MPVFLKELKRELQDDRDKVGKNKDGSYRSTPPNIIGRLVKDYKKLPVSKFTSRATESRDWLLFKSVVSSEVGSDKYLVSIQFNDIKFKEVQTTQFKNLVISNKKVKLYHRTPTATSNPVRIRCSCMDFQHRFSNQLKIFDALVGVPNSYTRKTAAWPIGRPLVNATDKIGFCKHVSSLLIHLKDKGLVKER